MSHVSLLEKGLELLLNGDRAYFNYFWLRDNCSTSWDSGTQERVFDILQAPDDLHAQSARIKDNQLEIEWHTGHRSCYDLQWLERWHRGENHGDLAVRTRKPWFSDHYQNMARFHYLDVTANPACVADLAEAILDDGIAMIQGMADTDEALLAVSELFGTVRPSFSGYVFDVFTTALTCNGR